MERFPCITCRANCTNNAILCSLCEKWTHIECVPMSLQMLKTWSQREKLFLCRECCFSRDRFDFARSLKRLQTSSNIAITADNEKLLLKTYDVPGVPLSSKFDFTSTVDTTAKRILEFYSPAMLTKYEPIRISGDGNCMYRAVSQAITGTEKHHAQLRLMTVMEMVSNKKFYDCESRNYTDLIKDTRVFVSCFSDLLKSAMTLGSYSELIHIYALSAAISKPIASYYPPMISSTFLSAPFTRKVVGRKVNESESPCASLMWSQTTLPKSSDDFVPNHFVVLKEKNKKDQFFIDLALSSESENISIDETQLYQNQSSDNENPLSVQLQNESSVLKSSSIDETKKSLEMSNIDLESSEPLHSTIIDSDVSDTILCTSELDVDIQDISEISKLSHNTSSHKAPSPPKDLPVENELVSGHLTDGQFLDSDTVLSLLRSGCDPLDKVPNGMKNDRYFIIRNDLNANRRQQDRKSCFTDDCGVWDTSTGTSPKTTYLITDSGLLKKVFVKKGVLGMEKVIKKVRQFVPYDPPPPVESIVEMHRYYTKLKADASFRKRVTWLGKGSTGNVAVLEYLGKFPGLVKHGNAKRGDEYIRTDNEVMSEIAELNKHSKPMEVYKTLNNKYDELKAPKSIRQIRDKKRHEKQKVQKQTQGIHICSNNIADQFVAIQNMVCQGHPFIRQIIHGHSRVPSIILYTDEQIQDLKTLCCSGQTVLGFDKTFNLCNMHVTASCYKQLSVIRPNSGEPPLFIGPLFLHDSSDFEAYSSFFSHLKTKLVNVDLSKLIIGTDDEQALKNSITNIFSSSTHVLCTRHLKQNATDKLLTVGVQKSDRIKILENIFGKKGLANLEDSVVFDNRCSEMEENCQTIAPGFLKYFKNRLKPLIEEKVNVPHRDGKIQALWTNNNCESINHVLKQTVDWKSKPLVEFITSVHGLIDSQFKDLRRAIISTGQFRLAEAFIKFKTEKITWSQMQEDERDKIYDKFRKFIPKDKGTVMSTDGRSHFQAPKTRGKKPNQLKRKRSERTHTIKFKK